MINICKVERFIFYHESKRQICLAFITIKSSKHLILHTGIKLFDKKFVKKFQIYVFLSNILSNILYQFYFFKVKISIEYQMSNVNIYNHYLAIYACITQIQFYLYSRLFLFNYWFLSGWSKVQIINESKQLGVETEQVKSESPTIRQMGGNFEISQSMIYHTLHSVRSDVQIHSTSTYVCYVGFCFRKRVIIHTSK